MASVLPVTDGNGTVIYKIVLTQSFGQLLEELKALGYQRSQKICIVTDSNVGPLYAKEVEHILREAYDTVCVHTFQAGENSKNIDTVAKLYENLIKWHFDRKDFLIALGGGVVGDLTGFAAATYLRGIDFIQVPTTLLSQVDSSIGGKTGVDFLQYKNMVGAFYQPRLVYMNLVVLKTLPERQLKSGMGEILKHGLIKDKQYFSWVCENRKKIQSLDLAVCEKMIEQSCLIKREVVERDPKERGERALLNFGHTIGHAIEKLSDFQLYHGECVALGIAAASFLSYRLGNITEQELSRIEENLKQFGFVVTVDGYPAQEVLQATKSDKKMDASRIKFILLKSIGDAYIFRDLTDEQILEGICHVCPASSAEI